MSIARKLTDRLAGGSERERRPYACRTCRERFAREHHVCPECGGFSVERTEWSHLDDAGARD